MASPAANPGSSTPGSAAAQALQALMLYSEGEEKKWLLFPLQRSSPTPLLPKGSLKTNEGGP